jgi:pyrimidine operon attenuation protein/uracil phosphoribosyltransferase
MHEDLPGVNNQSVHRLCDGAEVQRMIGEIARKLAESRQPTVPFYLVGIRTRGVPLALRLARELKHLLAVKEIKVGAVDITLYRDDLRSVDHWPVLRGTEIPFDIDGAEVVLVDDVLFTGRTVRAALNAICDLGRPACVRLAVLVDRGHRELPVQPDAVGLNVTSEHQDRVRVRLQPVDAVDEIVQIAGNADPSGSEGSPAP